DGLYYGGVQQAGEKLAAQAYQELPNIPKMGGDGMYSVGMIADIPVQSEGWYATIAAPDTIDAPEGADWVAKFHAKYQKDPDNYSLTAYDAVLVVSDTVSRLVNDGMPLTRQNVRDYAQQANLPT